MNRIKNDQLWLYIICVIAALLVAASAAHCQTTTAIISGRVVGLDQAVVTSGKIVITLKPPVDATISGTGRFSPTPPITCKLFGGPPPPGIPPGTNIANATLTGPCIVTRTTSLYPIGMYYVFDICPSNNCTSRFASYVIADMDISTAVPTPSTAPVVYNTASISYSQIIDPPQLPLTTGVIGNCFFGQYSAVNGQFTCYTLASTGLTDSGTLMRTDTPLADAQVQTKYKTSVCQIPVDGTGAAGVIQAADARSQDCYNSFGTTLTVTSVKCYRDAGASTIMLNSGGTNLLSANCSPTNGTWATCSLNGTPTIASGGTVTTTLPFIDGTTTKLYCAVTTTR